MAKKNVRTKSMERVMITPPQAAVLASKILGRTMSDRWVKGLIAAEHARYTLDDQGFLKVPRDANFPYCATWGPPATKGSKSHFLLNRYHFIKYCDKLAKQEAKTRKKILIKMSKEEHPLVQEFLANLRQETV